ncbi:MAG: ABC transporter permease [Provencibacterium sp.]|jgi:peptide/nickel transport system permease protein|nr:ABC transporter permease [Provencibacterium sp.]
MKNRVFAFGKRLLGLILSLLVLSAAVFYLSRLAPGDPLVSYYGDRAEKMSAAEREWAEKKLGLDAPVSVQYLRWLERAVHGDFGISYQYKRDVLEVIGERAGNTLLLGGAGFFLIFGGALLLGVLCVWWEGRLPDRLLCRVGTVTSCVPEFWLSLLLIFIFAVRLRLLPSSGAYSTGGSAGAGDRLRHLLLPLAAVTLGHLWYYAYLVRNRLLEEVRAEYVLLAKSKGLGKRAILFRHCLRNLLPAYLSILAISAPHILGGTYIIETVFSYPGLGTLVYESARYQDYHLLMILSLLSGALVILCNTVGQLINGRIDPRIRDPEAAAGEGARR